MGFVIFLIIVAVVIFIVIQKNKNKKRNAIEDLMNCKAYQLALKIKDELSMKGYSIDLGNEPLIYDNGAVGIWYISSLSGAIYYCANNSEYSPLRMYIEGNISIKNARAGRRCFYAIKNDNIGILIASLKETNEMPPFIEIAIEVIKNNGYGSSTLIE